jgi:UDP-N-acetylglucosamine diphosphorylase/glucosamine-1-phosphate N-acetyltransferase
LENINENKNDNKLTINIASINISCVFNYIWELFDVIGSEIENDFNDYMTEKQNFRNDLDKNTFVSKSANINTKVVFDSSNGKIIVDDNAVIMPLSFIQGPCYIGKNTIIKAGTIIYKNCCFGPYCKIGGEIETSIFQGYSNKQHHGFIGHSFISEWVNIGAGTSNSDLKNNYSNIIIQLSDKKIETNKKFIGAMIGDHCKMAINSSLNTGTIIGICSNVAKTELTKKYISPFSWLSDNYEEKYDLQKVILTAKVVMSRRNKEFTFEEQQLITDCFIK